MKAFRCWYKDGSARLVDAADHATAAGEAQELATIQNAPAPDKAKSPDEYTRYLAACKVVKTGCLTDGTVSRWK